MYIILILTTIIIITIITPTTTIALKLIHHIQLLEEFHGEEIAVKEACNTHVFMLRGVTELMYWFVKDNKKNQNLAFEELHFFYDCINFDMNTHKLFEAVFSGKC